MQSLGARLDIYGTLAGGVRSLLAIPFYACIAASAIRISFSLLGRARVWLQERTVNTGVSDRSFFLISLAVMLIGWLPVWLACYPGNYYYDQHQIYEQYLTHTINSKHSPLIYWLTGLIIDVCYRATGSFNIGIAVRVVLQALIVAACFSWVMMKVRRDLCGARGYITVPLLIYYALFPVISISVICTTKDVLYSALSLVWMIELMGLIRDDGIALKKLVTFFLTGSLMLLCRKTGLYSMVVALPFILLCCPGRKWGAGTRRRLAGAICATIVMNMFIISIVYSALGVQKDSGKDALSIPIQQLARAYHEVPEVFTDKEAELIRVIMPDGDAQPHYTPVSADTSKHDIDIGYIKDHLGDYVRLWLSVGRRVPVVYLDAFLMTNYYGWYPSALIDGYQQAGRHLSDETSYFFMGVEEPGTLDSRIPALYSAYYRLTRSITFQRIPVISLLFSPGFLFWVLLYVMGVLYCRRDAAGLTPLWYALMICASIFFGPMILVRYMLILFYLTGYFIVALFKPDSGEPSVMEDRHEGK